LIERRQGEAEYQIAQTLKTQYRLSGNVASFSELHRSLYICYFAGLPYYGVTAPGSADDIRRELDRYKVRYLFVWQGQEPPAHLLDGMLPITGTALATQLQIFAVRPKANGPAAVAPKAAGRDLEFSGRDSPVHGLNF